MLKKIWVLWTICLLFVGVTACGKSKCQETPTTKHIPDDKNVAVNAGKIKVYADEAKYYLFTAQATYETYYLTQDESIDWGKKMTGNTTWETVVKGQVLDEICQRECFYALAGQYNVSLTDLEQVTLNKMVKAYFSETDEELKKKIGIDEKRLKTIFEKDMVARKVEDVLEAMSADDGSDQKKGDEIYRQWKENNLVMATETWEEIRLEGHIFTKEDLTNNQVLLDETGTK